MFKSKKNIIAGMILTLVTTAATAGELKSVGIAMGMSNPFFNAIAKGASDRAHQVNKDVKVTTVYAENDLNKQVSQIDTFINTKVDLIILNAADSDAVFPAVKRAKAAGIPVIAVDVKAAGADAFVATDNVKAGEMACGWLAQKLGGKGKIVIMPGAPVSSLKDRVKGCKQELSKGKFDILADSQSGHSTRDGGLAVGQSLLTRFPQVDGWYATTDQMAIGSDLAAKQLNRKGFPIVAADGSPEIEAAMKSPGLIEASVAQDPYGMAVKAVDIGAEMVSTGKKPENADVLLEPSMLTRDNIAQYKGWTTH